MESTAPQADDATSEEQYHEFHRANDIIGQLQDAGSDLQLDLVLAVEESHDEASEEVEHHTNYPLPTDHLSVYLLEDSSRCVVRYDDPNHIRSAIVDGGTLVAVVNDVSEDYDHLTDDDLSNIHAASETLHDALNAVLEDHYDHYELTDAELTWLHDALDTAAADEPDTPSNGDSSYVDEDDGHVITLGDRDIFREYVENPPESDKEYPIEVKTAVNILQSAHGHAADEITGDDLSGYDDLYVFTVENGGHHE